MTKRKNGVRAPFNAEISKAYALSRLEQLLDQITEIRRDGRNSRLLSPWINDVKALLSQLYGDDSFLFKQFDGILFWSPISYLGQPDSDHEPFFAEGLEQAEGFLRSRISELRHEIELAARGAEDRKPVRSKDPVSRNIFLVHGHDHGLKETVARFLAKLDLSPIILHEQADRGKTLIEKFETHAADVDSAVVILSADDTGGSKETPEQKEFRARQNVILELGYFVGRLGREHTFALVQKDVTLPSDIHGLIYIPLDTPEWRLLLVRELKAAGLDVDANRAF